MLDQHFLTLLLIQTLGLLDLLCVNILTLLLSVIGGECMVFQLVHPRQLYSGMLPRVAGCHCLKACTERKNEGRGSWWRKWVERHSSSSIDDGTEGGGSVEASWWLVFKKPFGVLEVSAERMSMISETWCVCFLHFVLPSLHGSGSRVLESNNI